MDHSNVLDYKNPIELAHKWLAWAEEDSAMTYPNAMSVATVDNSGSPSIRVVLLKELNEKGFVFFTNYESRKGLEISNNPKIAANFYWDKPFRQLKVVGTAKKVSREDSVAYWKTRPRESQISQYVSKQSTPVESKELMDELYSKAKFDLEDKIIDCPKNWGGYIILPHEMEFWIGSTHRFHDRYKFIKKDSGNWLVQRLFP